MHRNLQGSARRPTARWATIRAVAVVFLGQFAVQLRHAGPRVSSDAVIDTRDVLTAAITIPPATYATPDERDRFYRGLRERLNAQPGVLAMSVASALPLSGGEERRLDIGDRPAADAVAQPTVRTVAIAPGYFRTLGVTLGRGRDFTEADGAPGAAHAIVNERFVEQFLGTADPIGQRIAVTARQSSASAPDWLTIVGVAPSIRQRPSADADPVVYTPFRSLSPATSSLVVRGGVETARLAAIVREEVSKLDPGLPVYRLRTMAQVIRDAQWNGRISSNLFLMLTFIAVALATIGLYAVTAHGVAQRAQEIALRMALGAQPRQVVRLVARRVAMQLALGFMAGIVCTRLWDWRLGSGSDGVTASDPQSLLIVAAVLVVVAMVACVVPARRAVRVDPIVAIRQD